MFSFMNKVIFRRITAPTRAPAPARAPARPRAPALALVLVCSIALSSCLAHRSKLEVHTDGSGFIMLEYDINDDFLTFAQYDDIESQISLPVNKHEFRRIAALTPGLEFIKYASKKNGNITQISATLKFNTPEVLRSLYGEKYQFSARPWRLTIPLVEGLADMEAQRIQALSELSPEISLSFSFSFSNAETKYEFIGTEPPTIDRTHENGLELNFSYSLQDLSGFDGPVFIVFHI